MSATILNIKWEESDMGDDEKIVEIGTALLSDGKTITAQGLTRRHVLEQINTKFVQQITGQFIAPGPNKLV